MGTFPGIKHALFRQTKTIDQNDIFEDSDEEFEKELLRTEKEGEAPVVQEDEEELIIEEFDD